MKNVWKSNKSFFYLSAKIASPVDLRLKFILDHNYYKNSDTSLVISIGIMENRNFTVKGDQNAWMDTLETQKIKMDNLNNHSNHKKVLAY